MSKIELKPYKGARDFYPEDKAFQKWMFNKWREVVESFGYVEYDAPILEPTDLFLLKGNQEIIDSQTYTFLDRGDRSVTVRTEMTPSISRMVASKRQELSYPLRWYSIPNLWRYERMQKGRLREFWQLNVDMFGDSSEFAELEMLQIIDGIFQKFQAKRTSYTIKINSRLLVNQLLNDLGMTEIKSVEIIRLLDKLSKMSAEEFATELDKLTGNSDSSKKIVQFMSAKTIDELTDNLIKLPSAALINKILVDLSNLGIRNVVYDPTLMRGFDYYTDIVFEVFDNDPENNRAILGGGRYDGLVGQMGVEPVPTIGFAIGDVVFADFLRTHKLVRKINLSIEATMIIREVDSINGALAAARDLREMGVKLSVDTTGRKIEKQLKSALKSGVTYIIFAGAEEIKNKLFTIKNINSGSEEKHSLQRIVSIIKDSRNTIS
ncbi:histidine--tRNA ligase [Candidatus Saccharibacteria bacterium]|nr:histidine--tRNA ligase [Candidatus Saccharibacteria bacterium]